MTVLSNLYSEKIITEHPIGLWMLNDELTYTPKINEVDRIFSNTSQWTITNGSAETESSTPLTPFTNSNLSKISGSNPAISEKIILTAVNNLDLDLFQYDLGNFNIGLYFYNNSDYLSSIEIGFQYFDPVTYTTKEVLFEKTITVEYFKKWTFISYTFPIFQDDWTDIKLLIKVNKEVGGSASTDYEIFFNGLTVGQQSENYHRYSLGVTPISIPLDINLTEDLKVITAYSYGGVGEDAYYIADSDNLYCKNFGIPLVYGSDTISKIYPNIIEPTEPSLIFPAQGFLNNRGKHNIYTAEMWVRVNADTNEPKKFFGPIGSNDGLYIDGAFLTFVLNNNFKSYYVGKWYRPMLIHIRYLKNNVSVLLNGEEIISMSFNTDTLTLSDEYAENEKSNDWVGFYAYPDLHPVEIDSFAIYSYSVPNQVAKRRWVWGQAVQSPEVISSSSNEFSTFFDYAFANYKVNYNYPEFANWKQGFSSNLDNSLTSLQTPNYELPEIYLGGTEFNTWLSNMQDNQSALSENFISLKSTDVENSDGYLLFNNFNILNQRIKSFYGVFEFDEGYNTSTGSEPLFLLENKKTKDKLVIKTDGEYIRYLVTLSGDEQEIGEGIKIEDTSKKFIAGLDIKTLINSKYKVSQFLADTNNLFLKIGNIGESATSSKIYKVGFDGEYNNKKLTEYYSDNEYGIFSKLNIDSDLVQNDSDADLLMSITSNYTLVPVEKYGSFFLDIDIAAYWQDHAPLAYFSKRIDDYDGTYTYDLDQLQINFDHPEPVESLSAEVTTTWNYEDLYLEYYNQISPLFYSDLDNNIYTGWEDYQDMSQKSSKHRYFDTNGDLVRTYVTFQTVTDGGKKDLTEYDLAVPYSIGVVDPDSRDENWEDYAYEVVNGTIVYPPTFDKNNNELDYNDLVIAYHFDFNIRGSLHSKLKLRNMQIVSQVYERTSPTEIGTKFGQPVYPYTKSGIYYDYKGKNPIEIYKGSTPHLYLTRDSGMHIHGDFSATATATERGITIPVNLSKTDNFKLSSLQMLVKYSEFAFPTGPLKVFTIEYAKDEYYDFYLIADESLERGYIYGIDRTTNESISGLIYAANGKLVDKVYLNNEEWIAIGVGFSNLLDISLYNGQISLNGPMLYNNISYFTYDPAKQNSNVAQRSWGQVRSIETQPYLSGGASGTDTITLNSIDPQVVAGFYIVGSGIPANTTILSLVDNELTLSNNFTLQASGDYIIQYNWTYWTISHQISALYEYVATWISLNNLGVATTTYDINLENNYAQYTGTNRIIIDDTSTNLTIDPQKMKIYSSVGVSKYNKVPA
jgi:hypothetical protein